jgi:FkbM family methyltransferase
MNEIPKLVPTIRKSIRKRLARLLWPSGHGIVRRDGVLYLLDRDGYKHDKYILQWGAPEKAQRAFLFDNIHRRNCETFLDIGAHQGLYTVCAALQTNCKTIIAYEPDARFYERLRAQLLVNGLTENRADLIGGVQRVQTRFAAVSDHTGTVPLTLTVDSSLVGEAGTNANTVPSVRLDDEMQITGQRIALKIELNFTKWQFCKA